MMVEAKMGKVIQVSTSIFLISVSIQVFTSIFYFYFSGSDQKTCLAKVT